ncbi:MAG: sigma-70 family RNA polymerase sigma factor, partial [bacterium]|nr:sigma-70 family RNA polymerase sigma factor [bacterium]
SATRRTSKRGGDWNRLSIDALADHCVEAANGDLPALAEALDRLAELRPRWALITELSFFAGLTQVEIAEHLDVSAKTVKRDWRKARQWLQDALTGAEGAP